MKKTTVAIAIPAPKSEGYPEFPIPKGYLPPEEGEDGSEFQELATFKVKDGKIICLTEIAGVKLGGKNKEVEEEEVLEEGPGLAERFSSYRSGQPEEEY